MYTYIYDQIAKVICRNKCRSHSHGKHNSNNRVIPALTGMKLVMDRVCKGMNEHMHVCFIEKFIKFYKTNVIFVKNVSFERTVIELHYTFTCLVIFYTMLIANNGVT